ncbi:MAG: preprotein translocase subunit SecG [Omnitrophica bacterium RIFCSPHIGHO2_02_FULL_51_18]|nr:MAG: preprotein translocase subunit SecG [Omnitrophica bacterium RIFCSPHIGHO2_02_FULL_51_18]
MYAFLIVVHIFVCIVLILVILLQAGRGGGLSDIAGGQPQSILGTQTNAFMTRATEVCAVLFILTSLTLGIMSTQKGKSLMEKNRMVEVLTAPAPETKPAQTPTAPVSPPAVPAG